MAIQGAIKPASFAEVRPIPTSRGGPVASRLAAWVRRDGAEQEGNHLVRTPTGELEVYRDPRGLEPTPTPPEVRHDADDPNHRAVCRRCRQLWRNA